MRKKLLYTLIAIFSISFAFPYKRSSISETKLNRIHVGMPRQEVVFLLGKNYMPVFGGKQKFPDGITREIIIYNIDTTKYINKIIVISFLNDSIEKWRIDDFPA